MVPINDDITFAYRTGSESNTEVGRFTSGMGFVL